MQVPGSRFLQGDFTTNETKAAMRKLLGGVPVHPRVESAVRGCATAQCLGQPVHTSRARGGWPRGRLTGGWHTPSTRKLHLHDEHRRAPRPSMLR